jgi:hypothetical protein
MGGHLCFSIAALFVALSIVNSDALLFRTKQSDADQVCAIEWARGSGHSAEAAMQIWFDGSLTGGEYPKSVGFNGIAAL